MEQKHQAAAKNQFGTFAGVFTPSILTIFGVIMFMRAGFVIGEAGILWAIVILAIAKIITLMTTFSVSAICTNMQVRGGGAYFLISRVLGPEFGGAIGLALFFAQALSVPFYILGFAEAVVSSFPGLAGYFQLIAFVSGALLFIVTFIGADWALKTQSIIMVVLFGAIAVMLGGAAQQFSVETLQTNWGSGYTVVDGHPFNFWMIFAIYFPAVTGILAGINMSGDLKDPARSIPRGTLYAVGVGALVYLIQIIICGGAFDRADLINHPYEVLKNNALFGLSPLVAAGVWAATLSSALGSFLGAPRILQAVSRDKIAGFLKPFAKGSAVGDEPRQATILTGIVTVAVFLWAGNKSGGAALNLVAAIITMFFLYTYGMVNLAACIEALGQNPSFRPRFHYFHWITAFLGTVSCFFVAFLIDPMPAVAAIILLLLLFWYIRTRNLQVAFGDARRGFLFAAIRRNLFQLSRIEEDARNWRPTILVFSGNPKSRETLTTYAVWLESGRGVVFMANIVPGSLEENAWRHEGGLKQLRQFCAEKKIPAFPVAIVAEKVGDGIAALLQTAALGPIRPNVAMFGWTKDSAVVSDFVKNMRRAALLGTNIVLVKDQGLPQPGPGKRIDLWWRGRQNGGLMVLLAYLLSLNWEWAGSHIRVLRLIDNEAGQEPALKALDELIKTARVEAVPKVIVQSAAFVETLHHYSGDADCVMLGFALPSPEAEEGWFRAFEAMLAGLPTTLLIAAVKDEMPLE